MNAKTRFRVLILIAVLAPSCAPERTPPVPARSQYPEIKSVPEDEKDTVYYSLYESGGSSKQSSPRDTSNAPGAPNTSPGNLDGNIFGTGGRPINLQDGKNQ